MEAEQGELGGVVVLDSEWTEYEARTRGGRAIVVRFGADGGTETRIWQDGSGGLLCRLGENGEEVPMYRYSEAMADPNTEAASGSAIFLQRLVAGGLPVEVALSLTNRLYSRLPHSYEMSAEITQRIIEQWRAQSGNVQAE